MVTRSAGKDNARKRKPRGGPALSGGTGILVAIAVLAAVFRIAIAFDLAASPLLLRPALEDGTYLSEIVAAKAGDDVLPRGSFLYPIVGSLLPGTAEGNPAALRVVQAILEGFTTLLIGLWARRSFGAIAGIAASALYLLDPLGGFFAARLSPVVWSTFLFVLSLYLFDRGRDEQSSAYIWITGVLLAIGLLFSPLLFVLAALVMVWRLWKDTRSGETHREVPRLPQWIPVAVTVPLMLALLVVLLRNDRIPDGGPTLAWGNGISAYRAASPATGGTERALDPPSWESELQVRTLAFEAMESEVDDYQVHRFYSTRAFQQMVENPIETIGVLLTKSTGTIGAWPIPDALSPSFLFEREAPYLGYGVFWFALLLGGAAGGFLVTRRDPSSGIVVIGVITVGFACLIGPASAAARQAALPLLAILGGAFVGALRGGHSARKATGADPSPAASSPRVLGVMLGVAVVSIVAGYLSPTAALRNPSEEYRLAANSFSSGDNWRPAIPLLERAVEMDPSNLEARVALSRAYQKDGLVNAAKDQLETALDADSTHASTLLTLAGLEMTQNNPARAMQLMARVVNAHPNNPLFLNQYGTMLFQTGQIAQSQPFFRRALEIKPDYDLVIQNLVKVEEYLQRMEQSVYPPEMRLAPDDPLNAIPELAVRAFGVEDWARADSLIRTIETARPDVVLPHFLRAAYHARRNEIPDAIAGLERCQSLAPCRPAVVDLLAGMYIQGGRPGDAMQIVIECERTATEDPEKQAFAAMRKNLELQATGQ